MNGTAWAPGAWLAGAAAAAAFLHAPAAPVAEAATALVLVAAAIRAWVRRESLGSAPVAGALACLCVVIGLAHAGGAAKEAAQVAGVLLLGAAAFTVTTRGLRYGLALRLRDSELAPTWKW